MYIQGLRYGTGRIGIAFPSDSRDPARMVLTVNPRFDSFSGGAEHAASNLELKEATQ